MAPRKPFDPEELRATLKVVIDEQMAIIRASIAERDAREAEGVSANKSDPLPDRIRIGAIDYEVKENPRYKAENLVGQILYYESTIEMQPDLSPGMRQVGLWHEALHGLLIQSGFREHDERLLDVLSYGIVRLLKDNPCLLNIGS